MGLVMAIIGAWGTFGFSEKNTKNLDPAQVLIGPEFVGVLLDHMRKAEDRIWVAVYVGSYKKDRSYAIENKLAHMLAKKFSQGLDVRVVLDDSYNWDVKNHRPSTTRSKKNDDLFKALKERGVPVRFDSLDRIMHGKFILIDDNLSFLGSHNWTYSALKKNVEASVLLTQAEDQIPLREVFEEVWEEGKP